MCSRRMRFLNAWAYPLFLEPIRPRPQRSDVGETFVSSKITNCLDVESATIGAGAWRTAFVAAIRNGGI